jgi:hypothetical protein
MGSARRSRSSKASKQFYSPGYVQQFDGASCDATKWCAAVAIFGLSDSLTQINNIDCLQRAGEEFANFAYLTKSGVPQGPLIRWTSTPCSPASRDPTCCHEPR